MADIPFVRSLPVGDGCEWEPTEGRPAVNTDSHTRTTHAEVIVGADPNWRLCRSCAALPRFVRFRARREIHRAEPE